MFLKEQKFAQAKEQKKPFPAKRTLKAERSKRGLVEPKTNKQLESKGCKWMVTCRQILPGPEWFKNLSHIYK